jgi:Mn2+/Fe2+ NRAMP family transporter
MQPPDDADGAASAPVQPPRGLAATLGRVGPGLIISANIVGSGELIVTTQLGAEAGFALLWFIIFSCFVKVFVQIELGRHSVTHGATTLEMLNGVPGPRLVTSWVLWLWVAMYVGTLFQISGMLGAIAGLFAPRAQLGAHVAAAVLPAAACALILRRGRYGPVERAATVMVALFSLVTIGAVVALRWTPWAIGWSQIGEGLSLRVPGSVTVAFAAFGVTGMGAAELIYYPYWCLEKGYARFVGPSDGSPEWLARARGWIAVMRVDAWVSMAIYTVSTICFYLLGAAVLHARGERLTGETLVPVLSGMYADVFGPAGRIGFLLGAFVVLFSTVFVSTASNARLLADGAGLFRLLKDPTAERRRRLMRHACVGLPALSVLFYLAVAEPVALVLAGALAQGLMLPFLGFTALHLRHRHTPRELAPGAAWNTALWASVAAMALLGLWQVASRLQLVGVG